MAVAVDTDWRSPVTGEPLVAEGPALRDSTGRWPVVDGIPFLRSGREALRAAALEALDAGHPDRARDLLLCDRDDWAPGAPPEPDDAARVAAAPTLREAMEHLSYGPVADYFAHRLSDPTYLSGLTLLALPADDGPTFELGCGIGLLLRAAGDDAAGTDVVFSKLWLARRWVVPNARLACCDARDALPFADGAFGRALCHDALYFLPEKAHVVAELQRVAPTVLIGHTHNALVDNLSAGDPLDPDGYAALLPGATLYDDAELTAAYLERRDPVPAGDLSTAPALALWQKGHGPGVAGGRAAPESQTGPSGGQGKNRLRAVFTDALVPNDCEDGDGGRSRNPLLRPDGRVAWPSARYAAEYGPLSGYLTQPAATPEERAHLRQDLDLPEEWGVRPAPLGLGFIGTGWVVRDFVLPAAERSPWIRVVAGHDPAGTPEGVEHRDLDALLADPEIEAVYVATPNHLHAEAVEAAAAANKAILCEKPMGATLAQAERIAAATRDVPYATAFDQRHHPAHAALKDQIAQGRLGTVTAVRIVYCCWLGPDWSADNWRVDPQRAGGGALIDLAPHGLDLTQHLLDDPLVALTAQRQQRVHPYAVDDGAMLAGRTAAGVLLSLHVAYNHPEDRPRRRLEVIGTDGLAVATDTLGQDPGGTLTIDGAPVPFDQDRSPFDAQLEHFARTVIDGHRPDAAADLELMRLLEPWR